MQLQKNAEQGLARSITGELIGMQEKNVSAKIVRIFTAILGVTCLCLFLGCTNPGNSTQTILSSEKAIVSFAFKVSDNPGILTADVVGATAYDINNSKGILLKLPVGTTDANKILLKPSISISAKATISPATLTVADFTKPVTYIVTAEDGTAQAYSVSAPTLLPAPEVLVDGSMKYGRNTWLTWAQDTSTATFNLTGGNAVVTGSSRGTYDWSTVLCQGGVSLEKNTLYQLQFDASSTNPADIISVDLQEGGKDIDGDGNLYTRWSTQGNISLGTVPKTYTEIVCTLNLDDPEAYAQFNLGRTAGTLTIGKISLQKLGPVSAPVSPEMVYNGDFSSGQIFWVTNWSLDDQSWFLDSNMGTAVADFSTGAFTLTGAGSGPNDWDWQLISGRKNLVKGTTYTVSFDAKSTVASDPIRVQLSENKVDINGDKSLYSSWYSKSYALTTSVQTYSFTFTMTDYTDPAAQMIFCLGKSTGIINIDNVSMKSQ